MTHSISLFIFVVRVGHKVGKYVRVNYNFPLRYRTTLEWLMLNTSVAWYVVSTEKNVKLFSLKKLCEKIFVFFFFVGFDKLLSICFWEKFSQAECLNNIKYHNYILNKLKSLNSKGQRKSPDSSLILGFQIAAIYSITLSLNSLSS